MAVWSSPKYQAVALPLLAALCATSLTPSSAVADYVGPAVVAKADRLLWGESISSPAGFDRASRASILEYMHALQDMQRLSNAEMQTSFKIKSINRASVDRWVSKEQNLSRLNYQRAAASCVPSDWTCVGQTSSVADLLEKSSKEKLRVPENLSSWRENFSSFSLSYVAEQLRLAALFPKVSSEIDSFNDNEINGDSLTDRQFFLSFDDGPTPAQGTSDETLRMLEAEKKNAVFFVLGEHFDARLKKSDATYLTNLYNNQCVGSHGWEHQSHAKWDQWQDSIIRTQAVLGSTLPQSGVAPLFRPPYGQRKDDSEAFFRSRKLRVVLWNLDSQDWNSHVSVDDIANRMTTLMLIKRHGILLFHDIHPKAKAALPIIFHEVGSSVEWADCHQLEKM